jgi:hypothetical protein
MIHSLSSCWINKSNRHQPHDGDHAGQPDEPIEELPGVCERVTARTSSHLSELGGSGGFGPSGPKDGWSDLENVSRAFQVPPTTGSNLPPM